MAITVTVNGRRHAVQASADTPLLYVLRNEPELNGPCSAAPSRTDMTLCALDRAHDRERQAS